MYDNNRLLYRWVFLGVLCLCCCLPLKAATTFTINVTNNTASTKSFTAFEDDSPFGSYTGLWGPNTVLSGQNSQLTIGRNAPHRIKVRNNTDGNVWTTNNVSNTDVFELGTDGNGPVTFYLGAPPPPPTPEYRFDLDFYNSTFLSQPYTIKTNGVVFQTIRLEPGGHLLLQWDDIMSLFGVSIDNGGLYPAFSLAIAGIPGTFWTLDDGSPVIPVDVHHTMDAQTFPDPGGSMTNVFSGQPGGTNAATDGTLILGFGALAGVIKAAAESQRESASAITNALAATPLASAGSNLVTAANNFVSAGTSVSNAAVNLNIAASNNAAANSNILAGLEAIRTNSHHAPIADFAFNNAFAYTVGLTGAVSSLAGSIQNHLGISTLTNAFYSMTNGYSTNMALPEVETNYWTLRMANNPKLTFALYPTWIPIIEDLATWIRFAIIWVSAFIVVQKMIELVHRAAMDVFQFTRSKSTDVMVSADVGPIGGGIGGSIWSHVPTAIVIVGAVFAAIILITSTVSTAQAWSRIFGGINPFTDSTMFSGPVGQGLKVTAEFVPWGQLVIDVAGYVGFRVFLMATCTGLGVWWQVVPLLFLAAVPNAGAWTTVQFSNHTTNQAAVALGSVEYLVDRGQVAELHAPDAFDFTISGVTNLAIEDGRRLTVTLGQAGTDAFAAIRDEPGPMLAFRYGTQAGGILGVIVVSFWLVRILRPGGETRLD